MLFQLAPAEGDKWMSGEDVYNPVFQKGILPMM